MARHKILKRIAIAIAALILVLIVAAFFVLRSRAFHRFVLAQIVTHADEATGGKLQLGDFAFHLSTLRVDLYRLAFYTTEPNLGHLSLSLAHLGVNLKIVSLLGAKIGLRQVAIDRPVVKFVSSTESQSNLPHPPQAKESSGNFSPFSLGINQVILDRGEIFINDRRIPLEARLLGLHAQAAFDGRTKQYDGVLAYRAGSIQVGDYQPVAHSLDLRFSANAEGMRAEPLVVRAGQSSISVEASLRNYSDPVVNGSYSAVLAAAEAARVLQSRVKPAGEIRTRGAFTYRSAPNRALFDSISLSGAMGSPRLSVRLPHARGQALAVNGQYRLDDGNLTVHGLGADAFGGRLAADASIRNLGGTLRGNLTASVHALSIGALRAALPDNRWAKFPIDGSLDARAQASWRGALKGLHVSSKVTLSGSIQGPAANAQAMPLDATLNVVYDARADTLTLGKTVFRTPQSQAEITGELGTHAALTIQAQTRDLHQTDQLVTEVRQFAGGTSARVQPLGLSGSASFHGLVQGTLQRPSLTGEFSANDLRVEQAAFPHVQAYVAVSESQLALSQGEVQAAQGSASFHALVDLRNWAYDASQPVSLDLTANRMSLAALASVAHLKYPVNGIVSAQILIHGTASRPTGSGTVQVVKAQAWNQPIQDVKIRFRGNGTAVHSAVLVETQGGNVTANLTYDPETEGYQGQITAARLNLGRLRALKAHQVSGVATASVRGQGTLKAPGLQAELSVPTLRLGRQTIAGVSAQMTVANQLARLAFNSNFSGILAHANGTVNLSDDYEATMNLSTGKIEAGPLLSSYLPGGAGNIQCETQLKAFLRGPLKNPQQLQAQLQIPILRLGYQSIHLSSVSAISANYRNGALVFQPAEIKGTGTDFHFQASAPLESNGSISGSITGTVNLQDMQIFEPHWASSGQLQMNVALEGTRSHPLIRGHAHVVNAAFSPSNAPLGIQNMNGAITFNSTRAEITHLTAQAGGGPVVVSGSVAYTHGMQFNLSVNADNVRLAYPQGVRETLASQLRLLGTENAALLTGQVLISDLSLAPQFDMMTFTNQFNVVSTPAGPGTSFDNRIKLNVAVRSTRELTVTNNQLSISGAAALQVQGTVADPVVVGRVTLASGGSLLFNGERFAVETGTINFVNPVTIEPVLNVRLTTSVDQYNVTLNFTGSVDSLRTTYTSSPPLSSADIIMLLISGHPTETPGTSTLGAESILASGLGLGSGSVLKLAGLSSLTIDPQVGGYQTNPGVNIAMQKQVTKNLFFTFSVNTSMSEDDTVQVQYKVSKRWSVEALRDPDGGYTLEIRSQKTF